MASLTFVFCPNTTTSSLKNLFGIINCQMDLQWSISKLEQTNKEFKFATFECDLKFLNYLYTSFYLFHHHYPNYSVKLIFEHYQFEINTEKDIPCFVEEQEILTELLFDDIRYFLVINDKQNVQSDFMYLVNKYFKISCY